MKIRFADAKEKLIYIFAIVISIFLLFFFIGGVWIGYEVKNLCLNAKRQYDTADCVTGLISQLDDENQSYRSRNYAIWALGAMGDGRALPTLQKYYTGNIPDREPLDDMISQYELKKAINLTNGGLNITAWVWRMGSQ